MKLLTRTPEMQAQIRAALIAQMDLSLEKNASLETVKMSYDVSALCPVVTDAVKPTIFYSPWAWLKIQFFTRSCAHECALHGLVKKMEIPGQYLVYDMLAYPQTTAAATVQATDEYGPWMHSMDKETFMDIRLQYHSHVNFAVTPSPTDMNYYESLINQVKDYYIFVIGNKAGDFTHIVYDKGQNIMFEKADILYDILDFDNDVCITEWLKEAKEFVIPPAVTTYGGSPAVVSGTAAKYDRVPYVDVNGKAIPYNHRPYKGDGFRYPPYMRLEYGHADKDGFFISYAEESRLYKESLKKAKPVTLTAKEKKALKKQLEDEELAEFNEARNATLAREYLADEQGGD